MAAESRQQSAGVAAGGAGRVLETRALREMRARLARDPHAMRFFQAVRLLERLHPERNPVGVYVSPQSEVVRFSSAPSLSFPASEIDSLRLSEEESQSTMRVNFLGLSAAVGALPQPYTEFLLERLRAKDRGPAEFFDIFNHRFLSLFYRAWEKYRFFVAYEKRGAGEDAISARLLDLLGLGTPGLRHRMEVADDACLYYAGLLAQRTRSEQGLKQLLEDYFAVPVTIEQFTGSWNQLPKQNQSFLNDAGTDSEKLGGGAIIGDEVWDQSGKVTVRLGPMPFATYRQFLPGAQGCRELCSWLRFYSNREFTFVVKLSLARSEVPALQLGVMGDSSARLGLVSWIRNRGLTRDPDEASYEVN